MISNMVYNIYCDETRHLPHDKSQYMVIGCVWCPKEKTHQIHKRMRDIKRDNGINPAGEIKWAKVSKGNIKVYNQLVNYFFDDDDINFRCIVIDKRELNHTAYGQTHDEWYYKMMFQMIHILLNSENSYNIYLDYKDSQSGIRSRKLHEVLCNDQFDFDKRIITNVQCLPSHEVGLLQMCDVLIGAIGYNQSGLESNAGKAEVVNLIKNRSGRTLSRQTLPSEKKFNLFFWHGDRA